MARKKTNTDYSINMLKGNRGLLEQEVARKSKQLNQRFYRIEKNDRFTTNRSWAYRSAEKTTGKDKPRFTQTIKSLKGRSDKELLQQYLEVNSLLGTEGSSVRGLRAIQKRSYDSLNDRLIDEGKIKTPLSSKELDDFFNSSDESLFDDYGSDELINYFLNYTKNGKVTIDKFFESFKKYQKKTGTDIFDVIDELDALNDPEDE